MTTDPEPLRVAFMAARLKRNLLSPESVTVCDRLHAAWTEQRLDLIFVSGHELAQNEHGQRSSAAELAVRYLSGQGPPKVFAINDHDRNSSSRIAALLNIVTHFAAERMRPFRITIVASSRTEALKYAIVLWRDHRLDADVLIADTNFRLTHLPNDARHVCELLVNYLGPVNQRRKN